ncbi:PIN-like domain-containing protein [Rhizobium leguminosarum]|uniref:PIN-like domain-containing protein n=1 Tax=Rhizobium leguminosarum TaxID=384 RepID=UPI00103FE9B5|nr:PIN-like domain-containing protein [Rhizobium leguminosarum]NKK29605.1 hypothetical protein [Rhizobium leguminosarum bv. viciae]TBZ54214.1 hypothetical protein E0H42_14330 [Rhizobium leguminosarum bv. viciae]
MRGKHKRFVAAKEIKRPLPPLTIPTDVQSFEDYFARLQILQNRVDTHIYFDTSFLVWLTGVSGDGRAELRSWLHAIGRNRIHIPVWAAHEYLRHHVTGLISNQLREVAGNLHNAANDSYAVLRPYLDTPIRGEHRSLAEIQTSVRKTLIDVKRLAGFASKWSNENYQAHVNDIFKMINDYGVQSASVFDNLHDIEVLEKSRYTGRIPPGFKDQKKKEKDGVGSNSFGDLEFWREILRHSKDIRAKSVIILSNDRKNDWLMGAQPAPMVDREDEVISAKRNWNPIPRAHPMLSFEARASAGVEELVLTDTVYLATYFKKSGIPCQSFFNAAVDVELPEPPEFDKSVRKAIKATAVAGQIEARGKDHEVRTETLFKDGPNVLIAPLKLNLAFTTSGKLDHPQGKAFVGAVLEDNTEARGITDFLQQELFKLADTGTLVWVARALVSRSQAGDSLAVAHCSDLLGMMDELPLGTATCLYLGFLAGAYFDGDDLRAPPSAPIFQDLLALQHRPFAAQPIAVITGKFRKLHKKPLYLPDAAMPGLAVTVQLKDVSGSRSSIVGLQINGLGVLDAAQSDEELTLSHLLDGQASATVRSIAETAGQMLGFPVAQILNTAELDREVEFGPTIGLIAPSETVLLIDE